MIVLGISSNRANIKHTKSMPITYLIIVTLYGFLLTYLGSKIELAGGAVSTLKTLSVIPIFIAKYYDYADFNKEKINKIVFGNEKSVQYIITSVIVLLSVSQIIVGTVYDYAKGGVFLYDVSNAFLSKFLPSFTGAIASLSLLWLSLDLTKNNNQKTFSNGDVVSASSLLSMIFTMILQILFQGNDTCQLISWSLKNTNRFLNFVTIYIGLSIFIFAIMNLLNVFLFPRFNNQKIKKTFKDRLSTASNRTLLELLFVSIFLVACMFSQVEWRQGMGLGCFIIALIHLYVFSLMKNKSFLTILIIIFQIVLYPINLGINTYILSLYDATSMDYILIVLFVMVLLAFLLPHIISGRKKPKTGKKLSILIMNEVKSISKRGKALIIVSIIISTLAVWMCFSPFNLLTCIFLNIFHGGQNHQYTATQMIDVTSQFANNYAGEEIAFWSIAANKYLSFTEYGYTDIGPICAESDIVTTNEVFIIEKAANNDYIRLKSAANGKYLSCIGDSSRYLKANSTYCYFNKLVYEDCPNPISAAYTADALGDWQEFKITKSLDGDYYYVISNTNYNNFGNSQGCYWSVFIDEKDITGNKYIPLRSVMITAGTWERFLIHDKYGNEIHIP